MGNLMDKENIFGTKRNFILEIMSMELKRETVKLFMKMEKNSFVLLLMENHMELEFIIKEIKKKKLSSIMEKSIKIIKKIILLIIILIYIIIFLLIIIEKKKYYYYF